MSIHHIIIRKLTHLNGIFLFFSESVSKPVINWTCTNTTVTCEVTQGTDPNITLYQYRIKVKEGHKVIRYKWTPKLNASFNCTATNRVSEETSEVDIDCSGTCQTSQVHFSNTVCQARARGPLQGPGARLGGSFDSG